MTLYLSTCMLNYLIFPNKIPSHPHDQHDSLEKVTTASYGVHGGKRSNICLALGGYALSAPVSMAAIKILSLAKGV